MKIEQIGDPIHVVAEFAGGSAEPKRFGWSGRSYEVDRVNARWLDRQGEGYCLHYSIQVGDETYYIHFSSVEVQWWLDQVAMDG